MEQVLTNMRTSRGRFFGLTTTKNRVFNAQFRGETNKFVKIYDRNAKKLVRLHKKTLLTCSKVA